MRIIWESKRRQIGLIVVLFLFVASAISTRGKSSSFAFWGTILFFGSGGVFFLVRLLNPKNVFVTPDTKLGEELLADQFRREYENLGLFTYTEHGFGLEADKRLKAYNWSDIETIFGFKEDLYSIDEVCMDIFTNDKASLRLTESTPGWYQFQERLSQNIHAIPKDWIAEIDLPAFETKLTLLFDRNGRTLQEAKAACYPE